MCEWGELWKRDLHAIAGKRQRFQIWGCKLWPQKWLLFKVAIRDLKNLSLDVTNCDFKFVTDLLWSHIVTSWVCHRKLRPHIISKLNLDAIEEVSVGTWPRAHVIRWSRGGNTRKNVFVDILVVYASKDFLMHFYILYVYLVYEYR